MSEQFSRYEKDLIEFIKSCKIIPEDKIPLAESGILLKVY